MGATIRAAIFGLTVASIPTLGLAETPLSVEDYAAIPSAQKIRMSLDGNKFAFIGWVDGRQALIVHDLTTTGPGAERILNLGTNQARWVTWKSDNRFVIGVFASTDSLSWYSNERNAVTYMLAANSDGTNPKNIGEPPGGYHPEGMIDKSFLLHPQIQDDVVAFEADDPHHILQSVLDQVPHEHAGGAPSVYQVDIDSGAHLRILSPHPNILNFEVDPNGVVRLGSGLDNKDHVVFVRDDADTRWRLIHRGDANGLDRFRAAAFVPGQPDMLYVFGVNPANGGRGLWTFDTKAEAFGALVDTDIGNPPEPIVHDGRLVSYRHRDGSRKYLDADWQRDYDTIRKALKGVEGEIIDRTPDGKRTLFEVEAPYQPASWWLLDTSEPQSRLMAVAKNYPEIIAAGLAPVKRITYQARDGLNIPAYLTLPTGRTEGPIPFVVLPHGGPNLCDEQVFDYEVQFLASRGWGVLQPEFRGSACFGPAFEERGFRQWGYAMQDDVTDGTRWLINQNLADPSRICIVGSSYGGYAALEGAVKEPDLYRCAAAWAPVTDLPLLHDSIYGTLHPEIALSRLGEDMDRLREASPARHADRIKVPVLIVHGKTDFTVQVEHAQRMERALKDAGKPAEVIYIDGADHFRLQYPARLAWLQALDRFLSTNLGQPN